MKQLYIGLDVHKASILIALAFAGGAEPQLHGKTPGDLDSFLRVLRRIMPWVPLWSRHLTCGTTTPRGEVKCKDMTLITHNH